MKKYTLVLPVLLMALFLAFSPAKASAYRCTATVLTPSVKLGGSAQVNVTVDGATEPVYVFARQQNGWSSLPLMPLYPIVQSIAGCTADPLLSNSCSDPNLFTKIPAPGGSVTISALTNTIHTALGSQSFNLFCSTNRPIALASEGTGANNAQNVQPLTASYTVTSGGADCPLNFPDAYIVQDPSEPQTTSMPGMRTSYFMAKDATAVHNVINTGTSQATVAIETYPPLASQTVGPSDGLALSLGTGNLTGGATTQLSVTLNKFTNGGNLKFNVTSSCGATKHTYVLSVSSSSTPPGVVGPPPPPPITFYGDGDFPIVVSGEDVTITEGQTVVRDVVVGNPKGYVGNVKISASRMQLPPGVNATFSPISGTLSTGESFHTRVTFKADGLVLAGTYKYQLSVEVKNPPGYNISDIGINTKNLNMTTRNIVLPTKTMPATVNTLRHSVAKMLSIRVETPGQTAYPCKPYACLNEYPEVLGKWVMAVKSWTNPVMILDKSHWTTDIGARVYNLADPMNPVHDSSKDLTLDNHWSGDFGGTGMYPGSIAYSRDGKYEISNQWTQGTIGSTKEYPVNGAYTGIPLEGDYHGFDKVDIFESKSRVYWTFLGGFNGGGVNRLDGFKKSAPYLYQGGSTTFDWIPPELPDTAPNIPSGGWVGRLSTDQTIVNTTVMAGAKDYVAALTRSVATGLKKLSIYVPTENDPVAEIDVKNGATSTQFITNMTSFVTSDAQYVMFMTYLPPLPGPADDPSLLQNQLFVYKFDPKTSLLTKVVEGIKVAGNVGPGAQNSAMTGIRVGNKDGVIMLVWDDKAKGDTNPNPAYGGTPFWKPKIFMFSDLSAGKLKDVFQDAGYSILAGNYGAGSAPWMASLNVGVSTYVYINTSRYDIAVLKFDPSGVNVGGSPPSVAICQDSTALNHGGTLPCTYPPRPRPACSPGDSFSTDTGLLCGATGTERKLSCVNLSSSFYCSNGQVRGATAFHFTQWLALGSSGNEVLELQKFLNVAGYDAGVVDGNFGAKTEAAVIKLQTANGLKGDGIMGAATRAVLNK